MNFWGNFYHLKMDYFYMLETQNYKFSLVAIQVLIMHSHHQIGLLRLMNHWAI